MHHRSIDISRDDHSSMHDTKPKPTRQHYRKTSSPALYAHGVISQSFTTNSHVRDWTRYTMSSHFREYEVGSKGERRGGGLLEPALLGEVGERGKISIIQKTSHIMQLWS